jgi:hypothetical protein
MMQEIQDFKLMGYSVNEIVRHYKKEGGVAPSLPTIRKYYRMDGVPAEPNRNLQKEKAFDCEPYRSAVIAMLVNNDGCCASSVYDVLVEEHVESGAVGALPGNEQTLRNYVRYLKASGAVEGAKRDGRIYDHVFDTPPGQQMLLDFGEYRPARGVTIHFLCMLLRYSRMLAVFAQDHKFNSEEACRSIYRGYVKLGGRPEQMVIDQDSVFVVSETYGEVVETRVFGDFLREQGVKLWVCNKHDPESKGSVENLVGFVKKNFFGARRITCVEDVWKSLPAWVERKNRRIHQATYRIPLEVFERIEAAALRPVLPSVYENVPSSFVAVEVGSTPYVLYKTSRYSVPRDLCFTKVFYKAVGGRLLIYDAGRKFVCAHEISSCRGSYNQLGEHRRLEPTEWLVIVERLRAKWNCISFQHFVNGFKKENPRHLTAQFGAVERFLESESPDRRLVADVMDICCENFRYRFTQFQAVYLSVKAGRVAPGTAPQPEVQRQGMDAYREAFEALCADGRGVVS